MQRLVRTFTRVRFPGTHELSGIMLIHCEGSGNEDEENLSSVEQERHLGPLKRGVGEGKKHMSDLLKTFKLGKNDFY